MRDPVLSLLRTAAAKLRLDGGAALALLGVVALLDAWGLSSTDPDFYLPDPFRPVAIAVVVFFLAAGFLPWPRPRRILRAAMLMLVGAVLLLELRLRYRSTDERVEKTSDVLLRYRYRPGGDFGSPGHVINHLGLMDDEHVIPKPAGVIRVIVMSGSIANDGSIPFDRRFWRLLEGKLNGGAGERVEVVNISVHGYSEVQQVRMLEKVGLQYQPDVVVAAYMLTAATLQNGAYRRFGDSFFLFRFLPALKTAESGSVCSLFAPFYERYTFDLIVRNSFERLALLSKIHGFKPLVAVLPVVERFDDPTCASLYDQVLGAARDSGLPTLRVVDAFQGETPERYTKPGGRWDVCHPNADGHERIAEALAGAVRPMLDR